MASPRTHKWHKHSLSFLRSWLLFLLQLPTSLRPSFCCDRDAFEEEDEAAVSLKREEKGRRILRGSNLNPGLTEMKNIIATLGFRRCFNLVLKQLGRI